MLRALRSKPQVYTHCCKNNLEKKLYNMFLKYLVLLLITLICIAFFTILERKILRYTQARKGPNIVGPLGLLQPFSDGLKLLRKKTLFPNVASFFIYIPPVVFFLISLLIWRIMFKRCSLWSNRSYLIILCLRRLGALMVFFSGWGGQRRFSLMGGIRASAQIISYEVAFSFLFLCPISLSLSFSFILVQENQLFPNLMTILFLTPILIVMILAETNRAPFDLTEGESELVRGFNTEFSSVSFTFLFLAEYSFILYFSFLCRILIWGSSVFWFPFLFSIIWVRSCFPRKRYDELINLMWIFYLPISILFLSFFLVLIWLM